MVSVLSGCGEGFSQEPPQSYGGAGMKPRPPVGPGKSPALIPSCWGDTELLPSQHLKPQHPSGGLPGGGGMENPRPGAAPGLPETENPTHASEACRGALLQEALPRTPTQPGSLPGDPQP